jgi:hypothetical protein
MKSRFSPLAKVKSSLAALGLILTAVLPACGKNFIVTSALDTTNMTSLRGAIIAANSSPGVNKIFLSGSNGVYHLTIQGTNEDLGLSGDLDVRFGSLAIVGDSNVVIDATGLGDRVFDVLPRARLTISRVTITGGTAPGGTAQLLSAEQGGGILNRGRLTLNQCIVMGNSTADGPSSIGGSDGGMGGGIFNVGTLILNSCVIAGNSTGAGGGSLGINLQGGNGVPLRLSAGNGGVGAGLFNNPPGVAILTACTISSNHCGAGGLGLESDDSAGAGGSGGGIYNVGTMTLNSCLINGNSCGAGGRGTNTTIGAGMPGGAGGLGGGILNIDGRLLMNNCTVSDNSAGAGGAGGATTQQPPLSSIPGGQGGQGGFAGGILNESGTIFLSACTVVLNSGGKGGEGGPVLVGSALGGIGGPGGRGGGIFNTSIKGTIGKIRNTLVALNSPGGGGAGGAGIIIAFNGSPGQTGSGFDLSGPFTSKGFNLVGILDDSIGVTNAVKGDIAGDAASSVDPLLGPLAHNGGPTLTHALLPSSPAIDQGKNFGLHKDQRGHLRPFDYPLVSNSPDGDGSDIGAFEWDTAGN